jgi:hypothetical protein
MRAEILCVNVHMQRREKDRLILASELPWRRSPTGSRWIGAHFSSDFYFTVQLLSPPGDPYLFTCYYRSVARCCNKELSEIVWNF